MTRPNTRRSPPHDLKFYGQFIVVQDEMLVQQCQSLDLIQLEKIGVKMNLWTLFCRVLECIQSIAGFCSQPEPASLQIYLLDLCLSVRKCPAPMLRLNIRRMSMVVILQLIVHFAALGLKHSRDKQKHNINVLDSLKYGHHPRRVFSVQKYNARWLV